jgi:hypothetical protein
MKKDLSVLYAGIGEIMIGIILIPYSIFTWGYIGLKFYKWFISPYIDGAPTVSYLQMTAILIFFSLFNNKGYRKYKYRGEEIKGEIDRLTIVLAPWILLLAGYVGHLCLFLLAYHL